MELTSDFGFSKINVSREMIGLTLSEAGLSPSGDQNGLAVVAIRRGRQPVLSPSKDETLMDGDQLIVAGPESTLEKFGGVG